MKIEYKYKSHVINGGVAIVVVLAMSMVINKGPSQSQKIQIDKSLQTIQTALQKGDSGTKVKKIQEILLRAPDLFPNGSVTGSFDGATEDAIKKFQIKNRLEISGKVDATTMAKLNKFDARTKQRQQLKLYSIEDSGRLLKLTGTGFTKEGNSIQIKGRTILADQFSSDGTTLTFVLPPFVPCKIGSSCPVKIINYNGISNAIPFKLTNDPTPPYPTPYLTPTPDPYPTPVPDPYPTPAPDPYPTPYQTPAPDPTLIITIPNPCSYAAATPAPIPAVPFKVLSPNGGENWTFGSEHPITWEGADPSWPICISLVNSTNVLRRMAFNLTNDGSENWIVDVPPGEYRMSIEACRGCPNMLWDNSDKVFTVSDGTTYGKVSSTYSTNQSLVLLTPKSTEEIWSPGSSHDILWSGGGSDWIIDIGLIDITTHTTAATLFTGLTNNGKATWNMPSTVAPGQYVFYISCNNCTKVERGGNYAYSFYNFSVLNP